MPFILGMFSSSIKLTPLLPRFYRIERYVNIENKKDFKQAAWLPVFLVLVAVYFTNCFEIWSHQSLVKMGGGDVCK
jgi:hypothetical protein